MRIKILLIFIALISFVFLYDQSKTRIDTAQVIIHPSSAANKNKTTTALSNQTINIQQTKISLRSEDNEIKSQELEDLVARYSNLKLTGIFLNKTSPKHSFAIILASPTSSIHAKIGDILINGLQLTTIEKDHIILEKGDARLIIELYSGEDSDNNSYDELDKSIENTYIATPASNLYYPERNHPLNSPRELNTSVRPVNNLSSEYYEGQDSEVIDKNDQTNGIRPFFYETTSTENIITSGTAVSETTTQPNSYSIPSFMVSNEFSAHVPIFMQGGELDIPDNQVPDFMKNIAP